MSHSLSKIAKRACDAPTQQMVERLPKVKVEVKEEPIDDNVPLAVLHGALSATTNNNTRRNNNKKQSIANSAAAAKPERVYKTSQKRRDKLAKNWYVRHFKSTEAISLDAKLLPDPCVDYSDAELAAFTDAGLGFLSGYDFTAVPLTVGNKNALRHYHARAYIPNADRPEHDKGDWMLVTVKATFGESCDAAVVARSDGASRCFPDRGHTMHLKLSTALIQLVPKTTDEEVRASPLIAECRRRQLLRQEQRAQLAAEEQQAQQTQPAEQQQ